MRIKSSQQQQEQPQQQIQDDQAEPSQQQIQDDQVESSQQQSQKPQQQSQEPQQQSQDKTQKQSQEHDKQGHDRSQQQKSYCQAFWGVHQVKAEDLIYAPPDRAKRCCMTWASRIATLEEEGKKPGCANNPLQCKVCKYFFTDTGRWTVHYIDMHGDKTTLEGLVRRIGNWRRIDEIEQTLTLIRRLGQRLKYSPGQVQEQIVRGHELQDRIRDEGTPAVFPPRDAVYDEEHRSARSVGQLCVRGRIYRARIGQRSQQDLQHLGLRSRQVLHSSNSGIVSSNMRSRRRRSPRLSLIRRRRLTRRKRLRRRRSLRRRQSLRSKRQINKERRGNARRLRRTKSSRNLGRLIGNSRRRWHH